jgi:hypothetical protein
MVDYAKQLDWGFVLHKSPVDEALRVAVVVLVSALELEGLPQGLPVSWYPVNAHRDGGDQIMLLECLGQRPKKTQIIKALNHSIFWKPRYYKDPF